MSNFTKACALSQEAWLDSLPTEFDDYTYSKKYNKEINTLINKMRNDKYHRFTKRTTRLLIVAAVIVSLAVTVIALPNSRSFIVKKFSGYGVMYNNTYDLNSIENTSVGYIPDGFEYTGNSTDRDTNIKTYLNGRQYINIGKYGLSYSINYDSEYIKAYNIKRNNIVYRVSKNSGNEIMVTWKYRGFTYLINGNISEEEALKIAYTVK